MASPLLPFITLRLLDVPICMTKQDITALFCPGDFKRILFLSLAEAVPPSSLPSQVATVTFASGSQTLDRILKEGFIHDEHNPSHRIRLGDDFHGLTPLNDPVDTKDSVDLIAVPGLGAQAFVSWQNVTGEMWLRDYLSVDVPNLKVFTYGFPSTLWKTTSTATLADHMHHFLSQLRNSSHIGRHRPLILLGHSIGCLMIRDALIKLSGSMASDDVELLKSIYAVYFFGAPNRGLNNDALLHIYGDRLPGQIIRDLGAGSAVLNAMNESWIAASKNIKIVTCFELCVTPTSRLPADDPETAPKRNGPLAMMVSRDSACYYTENETRIPINANHSMLAKLDNQPGSSYHTIARTLREHVREALSLRDRDFSSELKDMKEEIAVLRMTIAALQGIVSSSSDRTADPQVEAIKAISIREDRVTKRFELLLDACSVREFDDALRLEPKLVAEKASEMRDIQAQVSSLRGSIDGRLRVLNAMLLKNGKAIADFQWQAPKIESTISTHENPVILAEHRLRKGLGSTAAKETRPENTGSATTRENVAEWQKMMEAMEAMCNEIKSLREIVVQQQGTIQVLRERSECIEHAQYQTKEKHCRANH